MIRLMNSQSQNRVVGDILDKVGVRNSVTSIRECHTGGIGTVLLDDLEI